MNGNPGAVRLLRVLAIVQAALIVLFAVLVLRPGAAPAQASPPAAPPAPPSSPAPAAPAPSAVVPAAQPAPPRSEPPAPAAADVVLFGRAVGEGGEAITTGWLSFTAGGEQLATISLRPGHSEFAIAGLQPGSVDCSARVPGYRELRQAIAIPAGVPRLRHDVVLQQAWNLVVKILTPEGRPLHAELAAASRTRRMLYHVELAAVVTAAQPDGDFAPMPYREVRFGVGRWRSASGFAARMSGQAQQPDDVAGIVEIDEQQPLWVSAVMRHRVLASVQVQPGQPEVVLTVALDQVLKDLGSIRGRVVDAATGAAVADAAVGFGDLQSSGSGGKSDAQGMFVVEDLRPGLLDVEIRAEKRSARHDLVLLQPGQALDLGDVPVFEFQIIKGRCEGLQGKGDAGSVSYQPLDPAWHPAVQRHRDSTRIAADGTFALYLAEGRYLLRASGAGGAVREIDTRALGEGPLVLQLQPEVDLRLDVQTGGASWSAEVFDGTGRRLYSRQLQHGWKFPLHFLPGDYRVELSGPRGVRQTRQLHLGKDGADLKVP